MPGRHHSHGLIWRWNCGAIGLLVVLALAACGASDQGAAPRATSAMPALASQAGSPTAPSSATSAEPAPTVTTAIVAHAPATTEALAPTTRLKETSMPDQPTVESSEKPLPPARPTPQAGATPILKSTAPVGQPPANQIGAPIPTPFDPALAALVEHAKADLARRRAVAPEAIRVVEVRDVIWPDPGLGCPQPGMAYKQVPVDGLLIRLESGGQVFNYHSGGSKAPFLCEQPAPGDQATPPPGGEGQ